MRVRGLWKLPDGRDWLWGKLCFGLVSKSMFSKPLIQFSADGWGCVPSQTMKPNYGGLMVVMVTSFKRTYASSQDCCSQCPCPCSRLLLTHASARESWTFTGKSGQSFMGSLLHYSGSWCVQGFVCALQQSVSPVPELKFCS